MVPRGGAWQYPSCCLGCALPHQLTAKQTLIVFTFHPFSEREQSFPSFLQFGKTGPTAGLLQKGSAIKWDLCSNYTAIFLSVSLKRDPPLCRSSDGTLARIWNLEWAMPVNRVITQPSGAMSFWYNSRELEVTRNYL